MYYYIYKIAEKSIEYTIAHCLYNRFSFARIDSDMPIQYKLNGIKTAVGGYNQFSQYVNGEMII